jgi:malate dehydrogenase (quinone)
VIRNRISRQATAQGPIEQADIVLIGGGIMSATLGTLLQQLDSGLAIRLYERAPEVATESSGDWNNAGTGHASLCEMNYTPERDGHIEIAKAVRTNEQFHESRIFWARMVDQGLMSSPDTFVRSVPHMSYVAGQEDVDFLRRRYDTLRQNALFGTLEYSEDQFMHEEWAPLMMEGRREAGPIAMTRSIAGTDVNFGEVTRQLIRSMKRNGVVVDTSHEVVDLERLLDSRWRVSVRHRSSGRPHQVDARFVFIGAGGHAIHLLQKSGIREARGYGGFPVSGQFLRATNKEIISRHNAKVYGKPQLKAPPLSMPHLDTRVVNGERVLLYGPFAGFSPRFLKQGSLFDLPKSISLDNLPTLLSVARDEMGLTAYLVQQVLQKHLSRIEVLRDFIPHAQADDWVLTHAGMRVQTIKRTASKRGAIEYGTDLVTADDGTLAGLMGASPGASTAVSIMLDVIARCFPDEYAASWKKQIRDLIPSHGEKLAENQKLLDEVIGLTTQGLNLDA